MRWCPVAWPEPRNRGFRQRTQSPEFVAPVLCAAMARAISLPAGILTLFFWVETKTPEFSLEMRL